MEDAPRHASLAFLRQYVWREVLEQEVLPHLLPDETCTVRILTAHLKSPDLEETTSSSKPSMPKSVDDMFDDDVDFRTPTPGAPLFKEDPLSLHELTSVFLVNETAGFAFCFHCLSLEVDE